MLDNEIRRLLTVTSEELVEASKYQIAAHLENFTVVLSAIERGVVVSGPCGDEGNTFVVEVTWKSKVGLVLDMIRKLWKDV